MHRSNWRCFYFEPPSSLFCCWIAQKIDQFEIAKRKRNFEEQLNSKNVLRWQTMSKLTLSLTASKTTGNLTKSELRFSKRREVPHQKPNNWSATEFEKDVCSQTIKLILKKWKETYKTWSHRSILCRSCRLFCSRICL